MNDRVVAAGQRWLSRIANSSAFSRRATSPVRDIDGRGAPHRTEDVRQYYEAMTPAYLKGFGEVFQGSRPDSTDQLLSYIADALDLAPGMRLLDAGCGVGGPSFWLADHHDVSIDALTLSEAQADVAQRTAETRGLVDRVRLQRGDFHLLAELYPHATFDRVMFLESICHAEDYRAVLSGAHSVLKSGGGLYIKDFYAVDHTRDPVRHAAQAQDLDALNTLYRMQLPRLSDLVALVCEAGFLVRFVRMPMFESTYTHWSAYEQEAGRFWAPTSGQPGEVIQAIELFCWKP